MRIRYCGRSTDDGGHELGRMAEVSFSDKKEHELFVKMCELLPECWSEPLRRNVCGSFDEAVSVVPVDDMDEYRDFTASYKEAKRKAKALLKTV